MLQIWSFFNHIYFAKRKLIMFSIFVMFLFNIVMKNCSSKTAHFELRIRHNALLLVSLLCQCGAVGFMNYYNTPWVTKKILGNSVHQCYNIGIKHDCEFMYHITSIDESLHNERRRLEFYNGLYVLVM